MTPINALNRLPRRLLVARGRTLIELLVAMTLSLMILAGVGALYLGANQTARVTSNVAAAEDRAQVALDLIGASIRRAGYSEIIGTQIGTRNNLLYGGAYVRGCTSGQYFNNWPAGDTTCVASAASPTANDSLSVWFQGDTVLTAPQAPTTDCLGNPALAVPVANVIYAAYAPLGVPLVGNVYYRDAAGNLVCLSNANPAPQVLVSNVEDFKVYFGFDDAAFAAPLTVKNRPSATSLHTANEINALFAGGPNPWDYVISAQVCLLVRTQENGVSVQGNPTYTPCPQTGAQAADSATTLGVALPQNQADGAIRRAYKKVFAIRSRGAASPNT